MERHSRADQSNDGLFGYCEFLSMAFSWCQLDHAKSTESNLILQPYRFAFLTHGQLDRASNDAPLGRFLRLTLPDKESTLGPESPAALVAHEALVVPLSPQGRDDDVVEHGLFAAHATRGRAARMATEAPSVAVLLHVRGFGGERLPDLLLAHQSSLARGRLGGGGGGGGVGGMRRTSPHSAQKK